MRIAIADPWIRPMVSHRLMYPEQNTTSPITANESSSEDIIRFLFASLVNYDWVKQDVEAGIAESWTVAEDKKTWTFKLRKGVKWTDGAPTDRFAFIEDCEARGLRDKILLVCCGEMGRTPQINKAGGRDHWGNLAPLLLAGGGFQHGQPIAFAPQNPPPLPTLFVSMLQRLGIHETRFNTASGTLRGLDLA